jgi:hypothetical protein
VTTWKDYQEQAAVFFRSLGLIANTDEHIIGIRGAHDVDVVVRQARAGIEQLWIVECKKWKTRVTKQHVATLAAILSDVGADRGILLSESGFQAGTIRMARSSNITLTSVQDLEENSEDERTELKLHELRRNVSRIRGRIMALQIFTRSKRGTMGGGSARAVPGADMQVLINSLGFAGMAESALLASEIERWPVTYYEVNTEVLAVAQNRGELLRGLSQVVADLDTELIKQESSARAAQESTTTLD